MTKEIDLKTYFLPYQIAWALDASRLKLWRKSRRVGATYVEAFVKTRRCVKKPGLSVWHSSADESAAKEFIRYCETWAKIYKRAGEILSIDDEIVDAANGVRALVIRFANGARIHGLSSNPTAFRSKGGDVVLDEFDWHEDQRALYATAKPCVAWGFDISILSTYKSKSGLFHQFIQDAEKSRSEGKAPVFSLHATTIFDAVEQGLLDKIYARPTTLAEREAWLETEKAACGDENIWMQEYCCVPADESEAFLTWDMIRPCEHELAGRSTSAGSMPHASRAAGERNPSAGGDFYVGMDIGRRRDLTAIWVVEKVGDVLWTREVSCLKAASFAAQDEELARIVQDYNPRRICIDQTGLGEKPVEDAQRRHGEYRVEGVLFTSAVKQELAVAGRRKFEDRLVRIPVDADIRREHHAVKKTVTASGNVRFDAERTDKGHADRFWAHMLALHAASTPTGKTEYDTVERSDRRRVAGAY